MREIIIQELLRYTKKTITIEGLETFIPINTTYDQFSQLLLDFEREGILEMVKSKGPFSNKINTHNHRRRIVSFKIF